MSIIITIIELLIIITIVATIHEFGHFLFAKLFHMTVEEFSIGFGKKIFQKEYKGTKYSLRLIPFGGYVAIEGEEGKSEDKNAFSNRPCMQRIIVLVMGVVFNAILSLVILLSINGTSGVLSTQITELSKDSVLIDAGIKTGDQITKVGNIHTNIYNDILRYDNTNNSDVEIKYVRNGKEYTTIAKDVVKTKGYIGVYFDSARLNENGDLLPYVYLVNGGSVAEKAGLKSEDKILSVNGNHVTLANEVIDVLSTSIDQEITLQVLRKEKVLDIKLVPDKMEYVELGIANVAISEASLANTWYKSMYTVITIASSYGDLFTGKVGVDQLSGIVGVGQMVSKAQGFLDLLSLTAMLSLAVGFANILPFPPLDGGKIVLVAIEGITRKKVPEKVELILSYIGLILLILLTILVTIKDIIRIF